MFDQAQYDAWMMNLSEYFIKEYGYHIVAMPKNVKEIWLVNPKRESQRIVMISSLPISEFNQASIENHRGVLRKVYQFDDQGLNISVNQSFAETDENNVIVGPGSSSVSSQLKGFKNIQTVLKPSSNLSNVVEKSVRSLNRRIQKVQRKGIRRMLPVTTVISAICIAMYFIMVTIMSVYELPVSTAAVLMGAYYKPIIVAGKEWLRLLTAGFLHADVFHLFMNLFALNMIARVAEPVLGKRKYLLLLLTGVVFGNLFVFIRNDAGVGLGLSGGIFALMGWLVVYLFESGAYQNKRLRNEIIYTLLVNIMISMVPGISFMAHLGGFVLGVFFAVMFSQHPDWDLNRKSALVMYFVMVVFLGAMTFNNMDYEKNPRLDEAIVLSAREVGLDSYANHLQNILK